MKILGTGEWAPLPPHESSSTPPLSPLKTPMVEGCEMLGGGYGKVVVWGGPIVLVFKV